LGGGALVVALGELVADAVAVGGGCGALVVSELFWLGDEAFFGGGDLGELDPSEARRPRETYVTEAATELSRKPVLPQLVTPGLGA
jgi:hypothetical protein